MRLLDTTTAEATLSSSKFVLSLAKTVEEVREVQRLRYRVFIEDMFLSALANPDRLDRDEFDEHCDHLIVRDTDTLKVVGTYRVLSPQAARRMGRYYSEQEFDLARLEHLRVRMAEAGRACIDPVYRTGAVIMLLWSGLAAYMKKEGCEYLIGCASLSLADGGQNVGAIYHALSKSHLAPAEYRVRPRLPYPVGEYAPQCQAFIPPLIKGYMRGGAWVCGEPAWDPDFNSADLFLLLPLVKLDSRYARHYFKEPRTKELVTQ
ncbi:MAG: GNAT family N-acetyltransferase [Burkholderiales bacterium]|nr:GNAT family N-acetyltransferase [Burkholderiales bacterium]